MSGRLRAISCAGEAARRFLWTAVFLLVAVPAAAQPRAPQRRDPDKLRLFPLRLMWTVDLPAEPAAPVTTDPLRVYVPLRSGRLAAFARSEGKELWSVDLETTWPVATDGALVFAAVADGIRAFGAADGTEAWSAPVGAVAAPPVAQASWLIVGTRDGDVLAFRGNDGALVWRRSFGSPLTAAPAIAADRVFLPLGDGRLVALQIVRGELVWERKLGGRPGEILALPDRVFVGASDNFLYCLSVRDGTLDWRWRTAADVTSAPAADEARVYFVSLDNVMRALDRRSGVQQWRRPMPSRQLGGPQVVGGAIVVTMPVGRLMFYAAESGKLLADLIVPAPLVVAASPVELSPDGGRLVAATIDSAGASQLTAIGPGADPLLTRPGQVPGRVLDPEFLLPSEVLPVVLTAPPALPKRGG